MSLKQMRFQVTSKLIRPNSWITQTVRQRIPNCWARNGESTSAESAATDARNDELTATGGSQMLATRNLGRVSYYCPSFTLGLRRNAPFSGLATICEHAQPTNVRRQDTLSQYTLVPIELSNIKYLLYSQHLVVCQILNTCFNSLEV